MINRPLYLREMRSSLKLLALFAALLSMYVICIVMMYDPEMMEMLDRFSLAMPEIMAAVGMTPGASDLLGFLVTYLYGFILLVFPMVYCILRSIGLIARYVDRGSMVYLAAAPVRRSTIALTQAAVLFSGIFLLTAFTTLLELACAELLFPGELEIGALLRLNAGLLALHALIGGICFLFTCACSEVRRCALFSAGIPALMYLLQMLANIGGKLEGAKYLTFFTLFDAQGLADAQPAAFWKMAVLLTGAVVLCPVGVQIFHQKDLPI